MAAGLGFKTFAVGEVLSAANVNGYLMQGVLVFTNAAARDAAITSPQEGQFAFTKDNDSLWYYSGSAWVASGATGDIEGVTAGTGISGGGTSGTVTITNDMATTITASGDIVVGTGSGTYDNLPIGTTGQILTADTTVSPYKVKWATPAGGGGKVLQVVTASYSTETTVTTTTFTDTGLSASITPSSASSKILVLYSQQITLTRSGAYAKAWLRLMKDSTAIWTIGNVSLGESGVGINAAGASVVDHDRITTGVYLDSPATTSAITYKMQGAVINTLNSHTVKFQLASIPSQITLMEIGA